MPATRRRYSERGGSGVYSISIVGSDAFDNSRTDSDEDDLYRYYVTSAVVRLVNERFGKSFELHAFRRDWDGPQGGMKTDWTFSRGFIVPELLKLEAEGLIERALADRGSHPSLVYFRCV